MWSKSGLVIYFRPVFLSLFPFPGALHAACAAEEAEAGGSQHGRSPGRRGQRVGGSSRCSWQLQEVRLRLCPPGGLWRAYHLREEHEALVSGPGHLRLQAQLQLDRHASQEETRTHSHSPQRLRRVQPSAQLRLRVSSTAVNLVFCPGRVSGYTSRGGDAHATGPECAGGSCSVHTHTTTFSTSFRSSLC